MPSPITPAPMMTVFGLLDFGLLDFGRSDAVKFCVVMTDSLHRDWPGQVQWVCSQPPYSPRTNPRAGQHPSLTPILDRE